MGYVWGYIDRRKFTTAYDVSWNLCRSHKLPVCRPWHPPFDLKRCVPCWLQLGCKTKRIAFAYFRLKPFLLLMGPIVPRVSLSACFPTIGPGSDLPWGQWLPVSQWLWRSKAMSWWSQQGALRPRNANDAWISLWLGSGASYVQTWRPWF